MIDQSLIGKQIIASDKNDKTLIIQEIKPNRIRITDFLRGGIDKLYMYDASKLTFESVISQLAKLNEWSV